MNLTHQLAPSGAKAIKLPKVIVEVMKAIKDANGGAVIRMQDSERWRAVCTLAELGMVEIGSIMPEPEGHPKWEAWYLIKLRDYRGPVLYTYLRSGK